MNGTEPKLIKLALIFPLGGTDMWIHHVPAGPALPSLGTLPFLRIVITYHIYTLCLSHLSQWSHTEVTEVFFWWSSESRSTICIANGRQPPPAAVSASKLPHAKFASLSLKSIRCIQWLLSVFMDHLED